MISGPLFGRFISRRVHVDAGAMADQLTGSTAAARMPSLGVTLLTILLPVLLMLVASLAQAVMPDGSLRRSIVFAGSPLVAMLLATLLALYTFGQSCGFDRARLLRFAEESLPPIAGVLLVVGAGGGFGRVLDVAGADTAIAEAMSGLQLSPLVLGVGDRGAAASVGRLGDGRLRDRGEHHGADGRRDGARQQGTDGGRDRRGVAHRLARERRRILAREGVPQHERAADRRDVDAARNDHQSSRAWRACCCSAWSVRLTVLIVDAHLDLSMNALEWNRDLTRPIDEIRARERTWTDKPDRGRGTVSFPEMRRGGVGLCVATLIARYVATDNPLPGWHSPEQAWAMTQGQLAWYRAMEERGELTQIADRAALDRHVALWRRGRRPPIGSSGAQPGHASGTC